MQNALSKEWKGKGEMWRIYLQVTYLAEDSYQKYVRDSKNSSVKKVPIWIWATDMKRHFTKEDIRMANTQMKSLYSTLLATRECNLKPLWDIPYISVG